MKFIVILIGIIGTITYIFLAGPKGFTGQAAVTVNRRQAVWERIGQLEAGRRDMLLRARLRQEGTPPPSAGSARTGAWSQGYRAGFDAGYFEGSFLAENRRPNPLFFRIPNP